MSIVDSLTAVFEDEVAAPEANPPSTLESIPAYREFFNEPELFQRIHVHLVGLRVKDQHASKPQKSMFGRLFDVIGFGDKYASMNAIVVADVEGADTGSTNFFPIGKHEFFPMKSNPEPIWDAKNFVIAKKGDGKCSGLTLSMYEGEEDADKLILKTTVSSGDFPAANDGWKEFVIDAKSLNDGQHFEGLEFVFKLRVSECADKISSKADLIEFCKSSAEIDYSEKEIITGNEKDNALLQCWRQKGSESSSKAVLWVLGRNDCFMHPHVAKALFINKGYDIYVLNYSCDGLCRKRGWVTPHNNSHNYSGNFDAYIKQIEGALAVAKGHKEYSKFVGYAHSTGGPVLVNYLIKKGDDAFDGFIFNSPFLDWGHLGGEFIEFAMTKFVNVAKTLTVKSNADKLNVTATPEEFDAPINYMGDDIVLSAWSAKLFSQYFFDFRSRPLHSVPLTIGFVMGVDRVHLELLNLQKKKRNVTLKPFCNITSRADDTLDAADTVERVDLIGPSRVEFELRHNAHDVFLSEELRQTNMAIDFVKSWMDHNEF